MATGLPGMAIVANPQAALMNAQQLAARGNAAVAAQQLRSASGGGAAAVAAADANARKLAGKKRKAAERAGGEKAVPLIPESPLFNSLMMQEHHVDELVKRRRLELQAAASPLECPVHKRLRIYIYNTHSRQGQSANSGQHQPDSTTTNSSSSHSMEEPAHWTLIIWGRVENPDAPPVPPAAITGAHATAAGSAVGNGSGASGAAAAASAAGAQAGVTVDVNKLPPQPPQQQQQHTQHKYPFTGFFKRLELQLDPQQYPEDTDPIVWDKLLHRGPHKDRLELKRIGRGPTTVSIKFQQDFVPPVFRVDQRLAAVLGMTFGQQQMVLTRLYSYIINMTRQPDMSQLLLDDKLEAILGTKQLPASALPAALGKLLQPIEPVTVTHTIDTSGASPGHITCVDFDVFLPTKPLDKVSPAIDPLLDDKQFETLDQKLTTQLTKLYEARRRRAMYLGFAEDPVAYLNTLIAAQARELRVARSGKELAVERRTDFYKDRWVDEAALRYLGRKSKQDSLFPALNAPGVG